MGRRKKNAPRCFNCRMHLDLCICAAIPRIYLQTKVTLVIHHREIHKSTNTGRLALASLVNSEMFEHGCQDNPLDLSHLADDNRRLLLMFPGLGAKPLTTELLEKDPRPVTLVVPDGSWRQARRVAHHLPGLSLAQKVILPDLKPSCYFLRHEPRAGGLATFEAIARAIGIIESPAAQEKMERLFDLMVSRTLWSRQKSGATANFDTFPI